MYLVENPRYLVTIATQACIRQVCKLALRVHALRQCVDIKSMSMSMSMSVSVPNLIDEQLIRVEL